MIMTETTATREEILHRLVMYYAEFKFPNQHTGLMEHQTFTFDRLMTNCNAYMAFSEDRFSVEEVNSALQAVVDCGRILALEEGQYKLKELEHE